MQLLQQNLINPTRVPTIQTPNIPQQSNIRRDMIQTTRNQHLTGANLIPLGEYYRAKERPLLLPTPSVPVPEVPQRDSGWTVAGRSRKNSR